MAEELEVEQSTSEESSTHPSGELNDEEVPNNEGDEGPSPEEIAAAEAEQQAQEEAAAAEAAELAAQSTATRTPLTSPYAQTADPLGFDADLREELEVYLPAETVAKMEAHFNKVATTVAKSESQKFVQAYEQQQEMASQMGIPPAFMADVKRYSDKVPETIRGTKEGAQVAIMYGIHERASQEGGNFVDEMERFVKAAKPEKPAATTPVKVQALSPSARTTQSNVSGRAAVPARPAANPDPLAAHFPRIAAQLNQ